MKLIILSLDALGYDDLEKYQDLMPNMQKVIKRGSIIKNVETIMPSLTYPIHTTIITGEYPSVHGIDHNKPFLPFDSYDKWNWYYKNIQTKTLIDVVNDHNLVTTNLFWPVFAGAKIKNNIPEIWDYKTGKAKLSLFLKYGSPKFLLKHALKYRKLLNGKETTALDSFTFNILRDKVTDDLDDLTLVHFLAIDGAKHLYGANSKHAKHAISQTDKYVGEIFDLVKDNEDISLVVLSDHSQIDSPEKIEVKKLFKENGLLFNNDYLAYPRTCDGSCYVHLKNKNNHAQIKRKLEKLVLTTKGIDNLIDLSIDKNISSDADFILDAKPGYFFKDGSSYLGQHGHDPKKGHNVFMLCYGKNIKTDFSVSSGHVINHAKTLAKILNIDFNHGIGESVDEIFK